MSLRSILFSPLQPFPTTPFCFSSLPLSSFQGYTVELSYTSNPIEIDNSCSALTLTYTPGNGDIRYRRSISVCSRLRYQGHKFRYELHRTIFNAYQVPSFQDTRCHNAFTCVFFNLTPRSGIPGEEEQIRQHVLAELFNLAETM